jgi:hypothetical protein
MPIAYFAARRGDLKAHRGAMIGLCVGGILLQARLRSRQHECCMSGCLDRPRASDLKGKTVSLLVTISVTPSVTNESPPVV